MTYSFDNALMTLLPDRASPAIVLATLNAKYIHASLGLRYLLANMGELRPLTVLREFTIATPAQQVVDALLLVLDAALAASDGAAPGVPIVGFGVYVWNVRQTTAVLRLLKAARPQIRVVLGGPEVSHELDRQQIVELADYVITGWGDLAFARLCRALLDGPLPLTKVIAGEPPPLSEIVPPYAEYSDDDLAHRLLYVESSRGCPFTCEFCLSALDKRAWAFDLDAFLGELQGLYQRGARNFKFVDRTFNLKIDASIRILQFFLDRLPTSDEPLLVHFEVVPDHLPERLGQMIARFPPGVLQLEVGVQSFNVEVQQRIARRQDNERSEANLRWLVAQSAAHVHADLIFGLPGETLESFALGFDRLYALGPHEIQLGLLKRLRGAPIARHTAAYAMVYDAEPPYTVRQTGAVDAATVLRMTRFARYWELVANSGRFVQTLSLLLAAGAGSPFYAFLALADWLWLTSEKTSGWSPESLVDALFDYLCAKRGRSAASVQKALLADYLASGARGSPRALAGLLPKREAPRPSRRALRQDRHLAARQR
ncbi:MAG: Radical [Proteobacteria bacterium]|nr:Radical [Pseudomonadota bacterium]